MNGGAPLQGFMNGASNVNSGPNNATNGFATNGKHTVLRTWTQPPNGVTEWEGTNEEMKILFDTLPQGLSEHLIQMFPREILINLNEIYLQLGQIPECVVANHENGGKSERSKFGQSFIRMTVDCRRRYSLHPYLANSLNYL